MSLAATEPVEARAAGEPHRRQIRSRLALPVSLPATDPVEARVDHDPVQPGGDGRVAAEPGGVAVRRQQRVLHRVGGLLAIADRAQRHRPEPVTVAPHQLGERLAVALDASRSSW